MLDTYMGSGYRTKEAREKQGGLSKPPASGFLAPGVPIDAAPPPTTIPPGAAAAAPAAAVPALGAAVVGTVVVGAGIGWWATEDVREFKKTAKQPFYDTVQFDGGYDPAVAAESRMEQFRAWLDQHFPAVQYQDHMGPIGHLIIGIGPSILPDAAFAPDGTYAPYRVDHNNSTTDLVRYYEFKPCNLGLSPTSSQNQGQFACVANPPGWDGSNYSNGNACVTTPTLYSADKGGVSGYLADAGLYWCPSNQNLPGGNVHVVHETITDVAAVDVCIWEQKSFFIPHDVANHIGLQPAGQKVNQFIVADDLYYPLDPGPWKTWVAPPGTQPSADPAESTVPERGRYVPFSLGHPFTVINLGTGSGLVTVPDQVIDPELGGVVIVPPTSPPNYPNPDLEREAKPTWRRGVRGGMIAINAATEVDDIMESVRKALPKHLQPKRLENNAGGLVSENWLEILEAVWDNWEQWDAQLFLDHFIDNQIEDAVYGRYFGARNKLLKKAGRGRFVPYDLPGQDGILPDGLPFDTPTVNVEEESFTAFGFTVSGNDFR